MGVNEQQRPARSVSVRLRIVMAALIPVFVIILVVSIRVIDYTRNQSRQNLEDTVAFYTDDISKTLTNVNRRMRTLLLSSSQESLAAASHMQTIQDGGNQALVNHAVTQLKQMFNDFTQEYGSDKHFFLYFADNDFYVRCTDGSLSQRTYRRFETPLVEMLQQDKSMTRSGIQTWKVFHTAGDEYALLRIYRKNNIYLGCWVRAEDLVTPLSQMNLGSNGFVTLCNEAQEFLVNQDKVLALGDAMTQSPDGVYPSENGWLKSRLIITQRLRGSTYTIKLFISNYGSFERLLYLQMALVLLGIVMIVCLAVGIYYLQRRLLKPLRSFSRSIQQIEAGYGSIESLSRNDLQELDKANAEFVKLLNEVERLKMKVNMQNLEQQAIQMDYLKMQIKPHFYLNCLNFIYNMIDLGEYNNAQKMSRVTSDYLRYLLRNGDDSVTLEEEMNHVRNYMEIQKMRYDSAMRFSVQLDDGVKDVLLPPMIVQTFVENAIKHALNMDHEVFISVSAAPAVYYDISYAEIFIRDNGKGFDLDTLHLLVTQRGLRGKDGHGVGIDNCMKRLYYYYGSRASVQFSNEAEGGALVRICLPSSPPPAGEEGCA